MKGLPILLFTVLLAGLGASLFAFQGGGLGALRDDDEDNLPVNTKGRTEWTFARFHYDLGTEFGGYRGFQRWAADYPKSDHLFVQGVLRLTRVNTREAEQVNH